MKSIYLRCGLFTAIILVTIVIVVLQPYTKMPSSEIQSKSLKSMHETNHPQIRSNLIEVTKSLLIAKKHVRGIKTEEALRKALSDIRQSLDIFDIKTDLLWDREIQNSVNICPEKYEGSLFGYPLFEKGFEITNCSYSKPLKNIITILLYYENACNEIYIADVLNGIHNYSEQISILLAVPNTYKDKYIDMQRSHPQLFVTVYKPNIATGKMLNDLIQKVRTDYVLIGHDITHFNKDARLERLIREIERLKVTVVAGASRNQHGHWNLGCFQTAYKNYSLIYHEGYDESRHECVFCDFIAGPFIIRTKVMKEVLFDSGLTGNGLFEDYFLRLYKAKHENIICPDSMFYVNRTIKNNSAKRWEEFGLKWSLSRLKFSTELDIHFSCEKKYTCFPGKGFADNPCCLIELANMVHFVLNTCVEHGIFCELQEGTLLGAVKLNKVLPWEIDADIGFLYANFSSLSKLKETFVKAGYGMTASKGTAMIQSKHWTAEMYSQSILDSEVLISKNMKPTKILFAGKWVNAPRNPGLLARNRYGHEIYAHAQHWRAMGKKTGWAKYNPNVFTECKNQGEHNCLDRYNADGNMQFREPIP